jgi:hypothetical protein
MSRPADEKAIAMKSFTDWRLGRKKIKVEKEGEISSHPVEEPLLHIACLWGNDGFRPLVIKALIDQGVNPMVYDCGPVGESYKSWYAALEGSISCGAEAPSGTERRITRRRKKTGFTAFEIALGQSGQIIKELLSSVKIVTAVFLVEDALDREKAIHRDSDRFSEVEFLKSLRDGLVGLYNDNGKNDVVFDVSVAVDEATKNAEEKRATPRSERSGAIGAAVSGASLKRVKESMADLRLSGGGGGGGGGGPSPN